VPGKRQVSSASDDRPGWTLAFQGNVHELPDADADLVEAAAREAAAVPAR
jgi:hypothetical protein